MKAFKFFGRIMLTLVTAWLVRTDGTTFAQNPDGLSSKTPASRIRPSVTFVELGSVNCIPCRMMQPVMKAIEEKYGPQIKVVFYDVWTREHEQYEFIYHEDESA